MASENVKRGTRINDLELLFTLYKRLLEETDVKGIVMAKGQPNQAKLSLAKAVELTKSLEKFFSMRGCFSLGICKDCYKFMPQYSASSDYGRCNHGKEVSWCDSCNDHTGGCWGKTQQVHNDGSDLKTCGLCAYGAVTVQKNKRTGKSRRRIKCRQQETIKAPDSTACARWRYLY